MNTETEAVTPESEPTHRRGIKSFVLRQGHMTAAQQKAIDEQWARVGVDYRPQVVDLDAVFQSTKPKVLEIGFGMGTAWHKKRHNKRRLIQVPFVQKLLPKLQSGGYIHLATDWEEYALQMLDVLNQFPDELQNTAADFAPTPAYRPETKFEARGKRLGHGVWDLVFRKK